MCTFITARVTRAPSTLKLCAGVIVLFVLKTPLIGPHGNFPPRVPSQGRNVAHLANRFV